VSSIAVDVSPEVIDWVMRSVTNNLNDGVLENLIKWKTGDKKPTFNQVETISKATRIPLGYFFLQTPPVETFPILQHRTIGSQSADTPSRELIDTINDMENIQEWMRSYMIESDYDCLAVVGCKKNERNPHEVVKSVRKELEIKKDWYKDINDATEAFRFFRKRLEDIGILVMMSGIVGNNTHRPLDISEFRAFTLIDEYAPLIFINANDSQSAKLFSLLHELSHIWVGVDNFYNDRYGNANTVSAVEVICNAIAAEILVPNELFVTEWGKMRGQDALIKVSEAKKIFRCGVVVAARKALDNQYINKTQYQAIVDEAIAQFHDSRRGASGGNYYATAASRIDKRFLIALDNSTKEGKTQFTDAFRLTNTNRNTFSNLMEKVRGIG